MATPSGVTAPYLDLARARTAIAYSALGLVSVSGVALAVLSANPHTPVVQGGRHGLPGWIAGPLSGLSSGHPTLEQFFLLRGAMGAAYFVAIALGAELRARWLIAAVVVLHVAFMLPPPVLSTD